MLGLLEDDKEGEGVGEEIETGGREVAGRGEADDSFDSELQDFDDKGNPMLLFLCLLCIFSTPPLSTVRV